MTWKTIPGYPNYQASDSGEIKRVVGGQGARVGALKQGDHGGGYKSVKLSQGGVIKTFLVHRLVASTFIPNPKNLPIVNHKDGNKSHNAACNLEWVSDSGNSRHSTDTLNNNRKVTDDDVVSIRKRWASGDRQSNLGIEYGVAQAHISAIVTGKVFPHLPMFKKQQKIVKGQGNKGRLRMVESRTLADKICELYLKGLTQREVADECGCRQSHVSGVVTKRGIKYSVVDPGIEGSVWKPVVGFKDYEVSDHGQVRRVGGKILRYGNHHSGYPSVHMMRDGRDCSRMNHRLVAEAFVPNPNKLPYVDHIDRDKTNARATNLRWATASDNGKNK